MKKKLSASSRPAKLVRVSGESIFNKLLSKKQTSVLEQIAKRQSEDDDSRIDYQDIPPLTDEQLAGAIKRRERKSLIAARLDPDVLQWLKSLGGSEGYSTRINNILRAVMEQRK